MDSLLCLADRFEKQLEELRSIARSSLVHFKHSACLIRGNKVFAMGKNRYFDRVYKRSDNVKFTIHAEIDVLLKCPKHELKGADIIIIRVRKDGSLGESSPCNTCIDKMRRVGIRRAYYSTADGQIHCQLVSEMEMNYETSAMIIHKWRRPKPRFAIT